MASCAVPEPLAASWTVPCAVPCAVPYPTHVLILRHVHKEALGRILPFARFLARFLALELCRVLALELFRFRAAIRASIRFRAVVLARRSEPVIGRIPRERACPHCMPLERPVSRSERLPGVSR